MHSLLDEKGIEGKPLLILNNKIDIEPHMTDVDIIKELKYKNIKVGIITDGRPKGQRNKIEALGLATLVDDIIITDELGGIQFRKPCDIAFRIMQTRWKLPASQIVYVADNPAKDFQAPQQLGMKSIWFKNKDGLYNNNSLFKIGRASCRERVSSPV